MLSYRTWRFDQLDRRLNFTQVKGSGEFWCSISWQQLVVQLNPTSPTLLLLKLMLISPVTTTTLLFCHEMVSSVLFVCTYLIDTVGFCFLFWGFYCAPCRISTAALRINSAWPYGSSVLVTICLNRSGVIIRLFLALKKSQYSYSHLSLPLYITTMFILFSIYSLYCAFSHKYYISAQ